MTDDWLCGCIELLVSTEDMSWWLDETGGTPSVSSAEQVGNWSSVLGEPLMMLEKEGNLVCCCTLVATSR